MVESFQKGYQDLVEGMVLPLSALQLDKNQDEKCSLWRVIVMKHKKNDAKPKEKADIKVTHTHIIIAELLLQTVYKSFHAN